MYSSQTLVSDGTVQRVDLSIEFIIREDIRVFVDDALLPANGYTWTWASDTAINLNKPVHNRGVINVRRVTAYDSIKHVFEVGGAVFKDRNVDENFRQVLYWCQDFIEGKSITDVWNDLNMHGYRIKNLGSAVDPYDAVSLGQYQADAMGAWVAKRQATQAKEAAVVEALKAAQSAQEASDYLATLQGAILDAGTAKTLATKASADATYAKDAVDAWQRGEFLSVDTAADLVVATLGAVTYMKEIATGKGGGGIFMYNPALAGTNDGGYIINGWVRQTGHLELAHFGIESNVAADTLFKGMLQTAATHKLPIEDYSGTTVLLSAATTVYVPNDLVINTNMIVAGAPLYFSGYTSTAGNLTAPAAAGSTQITVSNAAHAGVGDVVYLRKNYDYSLCEFSQTISTRTYYKDGEAARVKSVSGNIITLDRPLKVTYSGVATDEVMFSRAGSLTINGMGTAGTGTHSLGVCTLPDVTMNLRNIITNFVTADAALWVDRCLNVRIDFDTVRNNATTVAGSNYGVSVANSQDVLVTGNLAHGLRHGTATGGGEVVGGIPCRNVIFKIKRITNNPAVNQHAADFHGNTIDSYYIDCHVSAPIALGGKNIGFIGGSFEALTTALAHNLSEWWGGEQRIEDCKITVRSTYTASKAFTAYAATALIYGMKEDCTFVSKDVTYVWEAAGNPLSLITASYANANASISVIIDNPTFVGFSRIDRCVFLNPVGTVYRKPRKMLLRNWSIVPTYDFMVYGSAVQLTEATVEYPESWGSTTAGGRWYKAKDGTMTINHTLTGSLAIDVANDIHGFISAPIVWTYPQTFVGTPSILLTTLSRSAGATYFNVTSSAVSAQHSAINSQVAAARTISAQAVGRWV